ncbi:MAG: TauD/TfdA family dioxygenase [Pseudomonadota bacterium]
MAKLVSVYGFITLRGLTLSDDDHEDLLRRLGTPMTTPGEPLVPGSDCLNPVSNVGRKTAPRSVFHTDSSYLHEPPGFTVLRSVTCPASGGDTLFTDQRYAFTSLPKPCRTVLLGRTLAHQVTGVPGQAQSTRQPLIRRHPVTDAYSLYMTTPERLSGLDGCTDEQSRRIFHVLYRWSQRRIYRHSWQPGDVVIWDNRITMHRADHSGVSGDRVLHRGMVRGEVPIMG